MKKRKLWLIPVIACSVILTLVLIFHLSFRCRYPRCDEKISAEFSLERNLVSAVIKAESGFDENAVSRAGAVGLMQIKPSTAEFICTKQGIEFDAARLTDGDYNVRIGCAYLSYLFKRFEVAETALAAYNAGEGRVSEWLNDEAYSRDGKKLINVPYPETRAYVKKVLKFKKFYDFYYS